MAGATHGMLLVRLDGEGPLHRQTYRALRDAIRARRLRPGERLEWSRELADALVRGGDLRRRCAAGCCGRGAGPSPVGAMSDDLALWDPWRRVVQRHLRFCACVLRSVFSGGLVSRGQRPQPLLTIHPFGVGVAPCFAPRSGALPAPTRALCRRTKWRPRGSVARSCPTSRRGRERTSGRSPGAVPRGARTHRGGRSSGWADAPRAAPRGRRRRSARVRAASAGAQGRTTPSALESDLGAGRQAVRRHRLGESCSCARHLTCAITLPAASSIATCLVPPR